MKLILAATFLVAAGSAALAHSPRLRATDPIARLDALNMPGLAPARSLIAEMLDDHPHPPRVMTEVPARRWHPFFFGWMPQVLHSDARRCEVIHTPYAGRIETCTTPHRAPARGLPLPYDLWLESR